MGRREQIYSDCVVVKEHVSECVNEFIPFIGTRPSKVIEN